MKKGFTLIELLVVVLIIGILSAVALPQYEKTVFKARTAEAWSGLGSLMPAAEEFCLANDGSTTLTLTDLTVNIESDNFNFFAMENTSGGAPTCQQFKNGDGELVAAYTKGSTSYNPIFTLNRNGRRRCGARDEDGTSKCRSLGFKNGATRCLSGAHTCYTE